MKRLHLITPILLITVLVLGAFPTGIALADTDTTGPITSAVTVSPNPVTLNETATITATVDDTTTGGSNIQSAEFSLNGGTWTTMSASDGAFDSPTEDVTATFTTSQEGDNQICVRGTDAAGNVGDSVCADFTAQSIYTFRGFLPPIRMNRTNLARAGRTVPVRWNLTMTSDGSPVSDSAAIVGIETYNVDCTSQTGDPSTAVLESGPSRGRGKGVSSLRYLRRGFWIFNWKVPKSYSGTCRMMFLQLSDGSTSPTVLFSFR